MVSVRFLTYSMFHNKDPVVGSTFIRVNQLMKYWPEAALYKYGENPDVMIFQKVYAAYDYKWPQHFEGIKILDICDPDWMEGLDVAETARAMDAITCPTETMAAFMRQLTDAPVYVVPDRWDIARVKPPKEHTNKAKTVIWFGYSHNADTLKPAMRTINELGLNLMIVSNDDPLLYRFDVREHKDYYSFHKFKQDEIDGLLRKADFAVLPGDYRPFGKFKSNNKRTKAILAGIPVATDSEELRALVEPENRQKFMLEHYATIKEEYDVRKSVEQMKEIIAEAQRNRNE
jgi:glycosyltransferase involved in cell wall biosynthesis